MTTRGPGEDPLASSRNPNSAPVLGPPLGRLFELPPKRFAVFGVPVTQGSMRAFVVPGTRRAVVTHDRQAVRPWQALIGDAARQAGVRPCLDGPIGVRLWFWLPRPPSKPKRILHPAVKPDLDKLARAVLDALTGLAWRDDAQVVDLDARKRYVAPAQPPGLDVELYQP